MINFETQITNAYDSELESAGWVVGRALDWSTRCGFYYGWNDVVSGQRSIPQVIDFYKENKNEIDRLPIEGRHKVIKEYAETGNSRYITSK